MAVREGIGWRDVPAALWARRTWQAVRHLVAGALLWLIPTVLALALAALGGAKSVALGGLRLGGSTKLTHLVLGTVLLILAGVALLALTSRFTAWQRARFRATIGEELEPMVPHPADARRWRRYAAELVAARTWRQVRYHALVGALTVIEAAAVLGGMLLGAGLVAESLVGAKLGPTLRVTLFAVGLAVLVGAVWLARGAAALDLELARSLLQPSGEEALARRVASLSASRTAAVEAADAERRRIERDLHDGTQQRLVSLAMNLGMTRAALRDAPAEVRQAVADAHEEAKLALAELRGFIRGLHPAVLDELGLDAALSGVAARSPLPVRLEVDLRQRPPAAVEAVAYFVVSETLTNAASHAAATQVGVAVRQRPGHLFLSVTDDGRGGADPARGTGLRGLRQRVESLDGTLDVTSPVGGPTSITVTLPCAW